VRFDDIFQLQIDFAHRFLNRVEGRARLGVGRDLWVLLKPLRRVAYVAQRDAQIVRQLGHHRLFKIAVFLQLLHESFLLIVPVPEPQAK
jgi:dihydropteroate synthase